MARLACSLYLRGRISLSLIIRVLQTDPSSVTPKNFLESEKMTEHHDIEKYFQFIKDLTLEAGEIIKKGFEENKNVKAKSGISDFVTDQDKKVEELFITQISCTFPDHKFIGEETVAGGPLPELTDDPTWIIDPIDGTLNYIHSYPQFCISVALAICKELVIGIVYNPINGELYTSKKSEGAFLNGKRICTTTEKELKNSLILIEPVNAHWFPHGSDISHARVAALVDATQGSRSSGSAALDLAYIARGIADMFTMDFLKPWDVAAGVLLVREAGGTVIDTKGKQHNLMKPNTIAAATKELACETSKLIVDTDLKTQRKRLKRT
ncbi:inositol-phosphate phosphatase [Orussus abietinus]|uniref:inositol-phosphate phosphatase n=1 Tax=Orussus abietinus TaxID=222816 RepID=UPI000625B50A|nr:inositol-phosphate phosphatase [Orussus abietinus]